MMSFLIKILYCIVLVALIEPRYVIRFPIHSLLVIARNVAFIFSIPMIFYFRLYKDRIFLWGMMLILWLGAASILYAGKLSDNYLYNTKIIFTMLVFAFVCARKMPKFFATSLAGIYALWIFLQGVMWKPGGLFLNANGQVSFFLGTKTSMTYYFIPAIVFVLVFWELYKIKKPLYSVIFMLMTATGAFLYLSRQPISTAILCAMLMILFILITEKYPKLGEKLLKYGFWITCIICVLFVYNIIQEMFSFIIVDLLGESIEMNGRIQIWDQVLHYIYKRPIMGYGYSTGIRFDVWQTFNTSAHSFYLFLVFSGGLVGLGIYFGMISSVLKQLTKNIDMRAARFVILTLIVINIEGITEECCFNAMYFSVIALGANIEYILPKKKRIDLDMDLNFMEFTE